MIMTQKTVQYYSFIVQMENEKPEELIDLRIAALLKDGLIEVVINPDLNELVIFKTRKEKSKTLFGMDIDYIREETIAHLKCDDLQKHLEIIFHAKGAFHLEHLVLHLLRVNLLQAKP